MSDRISRKVRIGGLTIGGGTPIRVQSMTNTPTVDVDATLAQIGRLDEAGCELFRIAVSSRREVAAFAAIREKTDLPLIADIQYNHRFAVECLEAGADKVRINPGNLGGTGNFIKVIKTAARLDRAVRIGINSGSISEDLLGKYGGPTPRAMLASAKESIEAAESAGFGNIVISMKSSGVMPTIEAYSLLAAEADYPLHLGITEAGGALSGSVKSAVGIGILLYEGLGDTIRVSLSASPETEIKVAFDILRALDLRRRGPEIISCPTCSRCKMDIISMVEEVEKRTRGMTEPLKVAVMGCYVNGPGEARDADVGLAGGAGRAAVFRKGQIVRRVSADECIDALMSEIDRLLSEKGPQ